MVHRPVRAHPRPVPAGELTVAPPPTVAGDASSLAGWLQYLVPLVGSGGSIALYERIGFRREPYDFQTIMLP